jgi:hypothetical protein
MARNFGRPASELIKIADEAAAFDFDQTVSARMMLYDKERLAEQAEIAQLSALGSLMGGGAHQPVQVTGKMVEETPATVKW